MRLDEKGRNPSSFLSNDGEAVNLQGSHQLQLQVASLPRPGPPDAKSVAGGHKGRKHQ